MKALCLLSGKSNPKLARGIAKNLNMKVGRVEIEEFPNREIKMRVRAKVKDRTVCMVQATSNPTERNIVELALMADAVKRMKAKKIIAVIPWFGYSPQDKVFREGEPLSAYVIIKMLESSPINEFILLDIHKKIILNKFHKKVHHISAMSIYIDYFKGRLSGDWCSVALDNGSRDRAREFSKALDIQLVYFEKTRDKKTGEVTFHQLKGDVKGKNIITFDDFVSTGGTTVKSCDFLKREGALKCYYCITHLVVPETVSKIAKSKIDKMFVTDSISHKIDRKVRNVKVVSIASILADFIKKHYG